MNKRTILLVLIMVWAAGLVNAAEDKIMVVDFYYKDGAITLKDSTVKPGYHPDRIFQPETGHRVEVVSLNGEKLYSFRFELPLNVFTDYADGGELKGGVIRLSETDFSLILPYFEDAKEINFYNERNYKVASMNVAEERFSPKKMLFPAYLAVAFAVVVMIWTAMRKRK